MAGKLPDVGVRLVAENEAGFNKALDNVNKKVDATSKALDKTAGSTSAFGKAFDAVSSKLGGFGAKLNDMAQQASGAQSELAGLFAELPAGAAGIAAVAAGAAVAATAFVALGARGAGIIGVAQSFDRLAAATGNAPELFRKMQEAAGGAISNVQLLTQANIALAGASAPVAQAFGNALPSLLQVAQLQARATGQDVNYLFESLVLGIKRSSPMIIDNTGLTLDLTAANQAYADSIGKSVTALTEEEKQIALINAVTAAGAGLQELYGGIAESNSTKLSRMNAIFTNIVDTLAVGVQPAFGLFLDVINRAAGLVEMLVTAVTPLIGAALEAGAALVNGPLNAILALLEPIGRLVSWLLTLVTVILRPVLNAITAFGNAIGTGFTRVVQFVGELISNNLGINFDNLALNLGRGAGFVFASFASGVMEAANNFIFPAVIEIATFIADFLVGESPPPKGPLSKIDKGGANVMAAWAEGFAGAGLQPVEEVAAAVEATLGNIGKMSGPQVEARLSQLDAALQPFNDQLEIVKANFEAINEPAKAALDSIDRQMAKAMQALSKGEAGSAEAVRALDAQRQKIQDALDAQQNLVDEAQIQQALAKSQQSEERALLTIQQARLKASESLTKVTDDGTKAATKAAAEAAKSAGGGAGSAAPMPVAGGGGAGGFDMSMPSVADMLSGGAAVDQMGSDLATGFTQGLTAGLNTGTASAFASNQAALNTQIGRIQNANIGERIANAFSGIGTSIQTALSDASTTITDWIGSITDPAREGSIPYSFNALISGDWTALSASLSAPFDDFALAAQTAINDFITGFIDPTSETGLIGGINALIELLPEPFALLVTTFTDNFDAILEGVTDFIDSAFNPDTVGSLLFEMSILPTRIGNALRDVEDTFITYVVTPIADQITAIGTGLYHFFAEGGEGTVSGYIDAGVAWFVALPQRIFDALAGLGAIFYTVIVTPMIGAVNAAIEGIETFINNALSGLGTLIGSLSGLAEAVGFGEQFAEIQASLANGITLPRIQAPSANVPSMPAAAQGGIFSGGLFRAGERGTEIIGNAASKTAVFPADVTRNIDVLARVLASPSSMELSRAGGYGGATYNNDRSINPTFNGISDPQSIMQKITTLQTMRGY